MEKEIYSIWLSLIPKLTMKQLEELNGMYGNSEAVWDETKKEKLMKISGIGEKKAEAILSPSLKQEAVSEWEKVKKRNIKVIGIEDECYPKLLKQIYDPPICLYALGNLSCLTMPSLAMVGSRNASDYGKKVAYYLSYQLAKKGICVVSGLANGVDSYSHNGAICAYDEKEGTGKTIAVVGTGLEQVYPKENAKLQEKILSCGGLVLSEYRIGTKLNRYHFPERNRIISGLSLGTIVVEAGEKSGSLITADFALEQGREVFAVPGLITNPLAKGTNEMIKQGAKIVRNIDDVLEEI